MGYIEDILRLFLENSFNIFALYITYIESKKTTLAREEKGNL